MPTYVSRIYVVLRAGSGTKTILVSSSQRYLGTNGGVSVICSMPGVRECHQPEVNHLPPNSISLALTTVNNPPRTSRT